MQTAERGWWVLWLVVAALCLPPMETGARTGEEATVRAAPDGWTLDGDADEGRIVYKQYCQKCHGKYGNGQGTMAADLDPKPRDFTNAEDMAKRSDWELYLGIKEGGAPLGLSDQMTAWEDTLTEQEMRDVAVYIRQFAHSDDEGGRR